MEVLEETNQSGGIQPVGTEESESLTAEKDAEKNQDMPAGRVYGDEDLPMLFPVIEATLFAMGGSVDGPSLARSCGCDTKTARRAARLLAERYAAENGGLLIRELDGSFQMCTNPQYYNQLIRLVSAPKKPVLTNVVMETLAIIACKSPATKTEIERIRGVKSDHAVNRLIEYGLVEEVGRLDVPGRPALFSPTDEFYRRFGVKNKEEVPKPGPEAQELFREEVQTELADTWERKGNGEHGADSEVFKGQ